MNTPNPTETAIMRKLFWRLVPFLGLLYVVSYLDRVNVGFAALTMNKDIGLSATIFGYGAGIFYLGYCLFEVPSNLAMMRVGARLWITRILVTWSICASAMALVETSTSFLVLRFLLGAAEAGFFPAVIVYLSFWFPARYRARIISAFMLAIPVALAVGAPLSTWVMHQFDGAWGLTGWQWLFIIEGLPGVFLAIVTLKMLPDSPEKARFLSPAERQWLADELENDLKNSPASAATMSVWQVMCHPTVLILSGIYFTAVAANLGLSMFMPQIVKAQGYSLVETGFISAVPYIFGCIGMLLIGHLSDRQGDRRRWLAISLFLAAAGLGLAGWYGPSLMAVAAMCIATVGIMGSKGPLWPLPSFYLSGKNAAVAIAFINTVGNAGGFFGPSLVGYVKDAYGTFQSGLYLLALLTLIGMVATLVFVRAPKAAVGALNTSS